MFDKKKLIGITFKNFLNKNEQQIKCWAKYFKYVIAGMRLHSNVLLNVILSNNMFECL